MMGAPSVLEGFIAFDREVSVIAARGLDGSVAAYDPGENIHRDGILRTTTVPARLSPGQRSDAVLIAARILNALDYVGVMGVELFVTPAAFWSTRSPPASTTPATGPRPAARSTSSNSTSARSLACPWATAAATPTW